MMVMVIAAVTKMMIQLHTPQRHHPSSDLQGEPSPLKVGWEGVGGGGGLMKVRYHEDDVTDNNIDDNFFF